MQAIVDALDDPYTDYLDPDELEALRARNDGAYFGVGLQVAQRDEAIVVTRVFDDGPADRAERARRATASCRSTGSATEGRELGAVVAEIRGPEGTTVRIGVATGTAPVRELALTRARIRVPSVVSRMETVGGEKVGYIRLAQFTRGSAEALRDAVTVLRDAGATALVLDLRGDPGGLVTEAVGVAGVFLPDGGEVFVTEGLHSPREVYRTDADPVAGDLPRGRADRPRQRERQRDRRRAPCATPTARRWSASAPSARRWCRARCCCATAAPSSSPPPAT